jgi:putative sterol carrier protein
MAAFADRDAAKGVSETYEYQVGELVFHFTVEDGSVELHQGPAHRPGATVTTDEQTWADVASGKTTGSAALATGSMVITGDPQATKRLGKILSRSRVLTQAEATLSPKPPERR